MSIKFDWDASRRQGKLSGEYFDEIREHFSVKNDAAKFARFRGRYMPARTYVITPAGRFEPGLYSEIEKYCLQKQYNDKIITTGEFAQQATPAIDGIKTLPKLNLDLRDYQSTIVEKCLITGRGTVVLATAGGKSLTIATLLEAVYQHDRDFTCALIVPDLGLVNQTYEDFISYGTTFKFSKWTGNNELDLSANVIICNLGILQSNKSDVEWLKDVDMCIVDEVHKLRKGNKINKLLKQVR